MRHRPHRIQQNIIKYILVYREESTLIMFNEYLYYMKDILPLSALAYLQASLCQSTRWPFKRRQGTTRRLRPCRSWCPGRSNGPNSLRPGKRTVWYVCVCVCEREKSQNSVCNAVINIDSTSWNMSLLHLDKQIRGLTYDELDLI